MWAAQQKIRNSRVHLILDKKSVPRKRVAAHKKSRNSNFGLV